MIREMRLLLAIVMMVPSLASRPAFAEDGGDDDGPTIRFTPDGNPVPGTHTPRERLRRTPPRSQRGDRGGAMFQRCDPKIMQTFYDNLYLMACQRSQLSQCPMQLDINTLKASGEKVLGYAMLAAFGAQMVRSDLNAQSLERARVAFRNFAPRAERMFGTNAAQHFLYLSHAQDMNQLKQAIESGRGAFRGAQHARYQRFLNLLSGTTTRVNRGMVVRAMRSTKLPALGGLILAVLGEVMQAGETRECRDKLPYIDYGDGCRPEFEENGEIKIGDEVRKFLDLGPAEQETLLRANPALCDYYMRFNNALIDKVQIRGQIRNVRCDAGGGVRQFTVNEGRQSRVFNMKVGEGNKVQELVVQNPTDPHSGIDRVGDFRMTFREVEGMTALHSVSYKNAFNIERQMNYSELSSQAATHRRHHGSGDHLTAKASRIFSAFRQHKFYSNLVNTCCSIQDDRARAQCVSELEGHEGVAIRDAQDSANHLAAPQIPVPGPAELSTTVEETTYWP